MLIVAIPKSASTSLAATLSDLHKVPFIQQKLFDFPCPSSTKLIHSWHSDMRELSEEFVENLSSKSKIWKQHIPPTPNNIRLLAQHKKIVLLRNPKDIVAAYYRAEIKGIHAPRSEFLSCHSSLDWLNVSHDNGLYNDLNWFYENWEEEVNSNPDNNLLIDYSTLLNDAQSTINSIENFLELPLSDNVSLLKRRYSRENSA